MYIINFLENMKRFIRYPNIQYFSSSFKYAKYSTHINTKTTDHLSTCSKVTYNNNVSSYITPTRPRDADIYKFDNFNITNISQYKENNSINVSVFISSENNQDVTNDADNSNKKINNIIYEDVLWDTFKYFEGRYNFFQNTHYYPPINISFSKNLTRISNFLYGKVSSAYIDKSYDLFKGMPNGLRFHCENVLSHILTSDWDKKYISEFKTVWYSPNDDDLSVTKIYTYMHVLHIANNINRQKVNMFKNANTKNIDIFRVNLRNNTTFVLENVYKILGISNTPTFYEILGIKETNNKHLIKSAYVKLALKYHPDIATKYSNPDVFVVIHNAYQNLMETNK